MLWLDMATVSCEGEPWMETQWLPVSLVVWITALAAALDARQQARFVRLGTGLLFARGRRTVTSWLRGCGVGGDYKRYSPAVPEFPIIAERCWVLHHGG
jgi:hypothetical protein